MNKLSLPVAFRPYEIACFKLQSEEVQAVLGEPHGSESASTRTYGGVELYWAYELNGERFVLVCRVPYSDTVIYSESQKPQGVLEKLMELFPSAEVEIYVKPSPT